MPQVLEYPPEPEIIYGAFDVNYRYAPIRPGSQADAIVGFGINNLPPKIYGTVSQAADCSTLAYYVDLARTEWKNQCLAVDFASVENPLEFLEGLTLNRTWLYSDQFGSEVRFPEEVDPDRSLFKFVLNYETNGMATGLMTHDEIANHILDQRYSKPVTVTAVEGDKITLDSGVVFHLTSRYRIDVPPTIEVRNDTVRAFCMRNLVMQRERRDSEVEPA